MPSGASVNLLPVKLLYCTLWIGSESELIQLQQFMSPPDFTKYKYVKSTHSAIFSPEFTSIEILCEFVFYGIRSLYEMMQMQPFTQAPNVTKYNAFE